MLFARQIHVGPEVEDVVQEAFVALARQRRCPDQPTSWLYRVVRNGAITAARRSRRRRRHEAIASAHESWFASVDEALDAELATRHLAALDPDVREVVVARLWGGLTFEQIAGLRGCSTATAYRRYQEGLSQLSARLERPCLTRSMVPEAI
jgi:RNA polymerase sigma factor (sigma-70 family)